MTQKKSPSELIEIRQKQIAYGASIAVTMSSLQDVIGQIRTWLSTLNNLETNFVSFEKCHNFMRIDFESGYTNLAEIEDRNKKRLPQLDKKQDEIKLGKWINEGKIQFDHFSCRYRPELPNALSDITMIIPGGCKVGIVGRTGAGKTTFISSIYRNFDSVFGKISIDGKDIEDVDVKALRSNITVIPQDPHLFDDTLRNNLDPSNSYSDDKITDMLKEMEIWHKFEGKGLDYKMDQGGSNVSQGERQVLCLVRALLSKNQVILLDEATANIDVSTEQLIQTAIETKFKHATILMIAHRLNTIKFCDKILVLEKGTVLEFGDYKTLENDPNSYFGAMLKSTDEAMANLG